MEPPVSLPRAAGANEAETAAARYGRILLAAERMLAELSRKPVVPDHLVGRHDHLLAASLAFNLEADTALDQRNLDQRIAPIGPQVELRTENPDVDLSGRNHKRMIRIAGHVGIELAVDEDLALRTLKARRIGDARSGIEPEHRTVRKGQLLPLAVRHGQLLPLRSGIRAEPQNRQRHKQRHKKNGGNALTPADNGRQPIPSRHGLADAAAEALEGGLSLRGILDARFIQQRSQHRIGFGGLSVVGKPGADRLLFRGCQTVAVIVAQVVQVYVRSVLHKFGTTDFGPSSYKEQTNDANYVMPGRIFPEIQGRISKKRIRAGMTPI